jgi:Tau95 Triple barrel domain
VYLLPCGEEVVLHGRVSIHPLTQSSVFRSQKQAMASLSQAIPQQEALAIEYPGYVANVPAVLRTLGGIEALCAAQESRSNFLRLHLRPGDPLAHPLLGDRHAQPPAPPCPSMLLAGVAARQMLHT